jgi:hypothetical protein
MVTSWKKSFRGDRDDTGVIDVSIEGQTPAA